MSDIILNVKIFFFVFAILCVIRDIYGFCKVLVLQEGKYEMTNKRLLVVGVSLSYIMTLLINGF